MKNKDLLSKTKEWRLRFGDGAFWYVCTIPMESIPYDELHCQTGYCQNQTTKDILSASSMTSVNICMAALSVTYGIITLVHQLMLHVKAALRITAWGGSYIIMLENKVSGKKNTISLKQAFKMLNDTRTWCSYSYTIDIRTLRTFIIL